MRLLSLDISNFRVIKSTRLVFPDRVIGVIGPNGAGKSSIIEAIAWALYGNQVARTGKDEIKSSFAGRTEKCEVNLAFSIGEEKYRVLRRLSGATDRAEVELYRGDSSESVGISETKDYISQLLGMDWRGFLTSFLARQQELNALTDLQPSRRKDHLAGMLGIERLDKAIQKVKLDGRLFSEKVTFLQRQLDLEPQLKKAITELTDRLAEAKDREEKQANLAQAAQAEHKAIAESFGILQEERTRSLQLTASLQAQEKTVANMKQQQAGLQQEKEKLEALQRPMAEARERLKDYDAVVRKVEDFKEARSRAALIEGLQRQSRETQQENEQVKRDLAASRENLAVLEKSMAGIPPDIAGKSAESRQALEQARDEYSDLKAQRDSLQKETEKLTGQLEAIDELGPDSVCDRCLRPLGKDLPEIRAHFQKGLSQLAGEAAGADKKLKAMRERGRQFKLEAEKLEKKQKAGSELSIKAEAARSDVSRNEERAGVLEVKLADIAERLGKIDTTAFDEKAFRQASERLEAMEADRLQVSQMEGSLGRLPAVIDSMTELEHNLKQAAAEMETTREALAELAFDVARFQQLKDEFERTQTDWEKARTEHLRAVKDSELTQKELEGKQEQLKGFEKAAGELEENRSALYYAEKLGGLFSEYRTRLISSIRPTLASLSSQLMAEMTNGKYSMIELDDKYNLRVLDYGEYFEVERFSGGEKDLANLCLRLAISQALTDSAGLQRSFIILDEVFGSQDSERRDLIIKALGNLKAKFPQVFLITHIEELKNKVEDLIEVRPTAAGWSEVIVNGIAG